MIKMKNTIRRVASLLIFIPFIVVSCSSQESSKELNEDSTQRASFQNVKVEKFKSLVDENGGTLLDVRTKEETDAGYIEGAAFLDFYNDSFEERLKTLNLAKPVYVYCRSGGRSSKAAAMLIDLGFKEVYNLDGGIKAWNKKGYKVVTGN